MAAWIAAELQRGDTLVGRAMAPTSLPYSLAAHLLNTGILATRIGLQNFYTHTLPRIALAGCLHDLGFATIPEALLQHPETLDAEGRALLRKAPDAGAKRLAILGPEYDWLTLLVKEVHEREDGSGYPRGLKSGPSTPIAKLLALVCTYEAHTHERPHRLTATPFAAAKALLGEERTRFAASHLRMLLATLTHFPVGSYVRLSSDEVAQVIEVQPGSPLRPTVQVLGASGGRIERLSTDSLVSIVDACLPPGSTQAIDALLAEVLPVRNAAPVLPELVPLADQPAMAPVTDPVPVPLSAASPVLEEPPAILAPEPVSDAVPGDDTPDAPVFVLDPDPAPSPAPAPGLPEAVVAVPAAAPPAAPAPVEAGRATAPLADLMGVPTIETRVTALTPGRPVPARPRPSTRLATIAAPPVLTEPALEAILTHGVDLDALYVRTARFRLQRLAGECLLVPKHKAEMVYRLRAIGSQIYEHFDGTQDGAQILDRLIREHNLDAIRALTEYRLCVEELTSLQAIAPQPANASRLEHD